MIKPLVLIDGNCQGQALSAIMLGSGLADAYCVGGDLGFVPGFQGTACRYIDEAQAHELIRVGRDRGQFVIQGTQSTPLRDADLRSYTSDVDLVIRYPHLQFYAQDPSEFEKRYGKQLSPRRIVDLDLSTVRTCQRRAASKSDFVEVMTTIGRDMPLFHTALHPGGLLTSMSLFDFASQLPKVDRPFLERLCSEIAANEGINFTTNHPVPPDLQKEIGALWGGDYPFYSETLTRAGGSDWGWLGARAAEILTRFPKDSQAWYAVALAATRQGHSQRARESLDRLLDLSPGYAPYWQMAFSYYREQNDEATVVGLVDRAKRFFRDARLLDYLLALILIEREMYSEAEFFAREYHRRTPDRYDSLIPILTVLVKTGRTAEARDWATASARDCLPARSWEFKSVFASVPGDWSFLEDILPP